MSYRWALEEFLRERLTPEDFRKADDLLDEVVTDAENEGYNSGYEQARELDT